MKGASRFSAEEGVSIIESLIAMGLVCTIGVFIFPFFARMTGFSKNSNFKEHCQRVVNAKIAFYNGLPRDQLIARYNEYRGPQPTHGPEDNALCGTLPTPPDTIATNPLYRAKIASFITENNIYKYGQAPELGLRECVELSSVPSQDVKKLEPTGRPYPQYFCMPTTSIPPGLTVRASDQAAIAQIKGFKSYVRMRLLGDTNTGHNWSCPAQLEPFQSYMNQLLEVQISVVSDYVSVGQSDSGGVVDPNALMCSARTSISLMKEKGPLAFRYFASQSGSPLSWRIHRVSDGWKDMTSIYQPLAQAMNSSSYILDGGGPINQNGTVTQFGLNPKGDLGYFIKVFENNPDPVFPLTSILCVMGGLSETMSSTPTQATCRILPRMPGNQIESILVDWKKGKMWGVSGRRAKPDRGLSVPEHQEIDSSYLLADCSGSPQAVREKAMFYNTPTCVTSDLNGYPIPIPTSVPIGSGNTITDPSFANTRKLDADFLNKPLSSIYSPDVIPQSGSPSKANHMDARALRSLIEMFSPTNGALFTVSTTPPRNCGGVGRCMSKAYARLFYSPDALTSYALMRYPGVTTESGCDAAESGSHAQIFRLEFPMASGSSNVAQTACPEMVMNLKQGSGGVDILPELLSY